jgi:hypothetical protein
MRDLGQSGAAQYKNLYFGFFYARSVSFRLTIQLGRFPSLLPVARVARASAGMSANHRLFATLPGSRKGNLTGLASLLTKGRVSRNLTTAQLG